MRVFLAGLAPLRCARARGLALPASVRSATLLPAAQAARPTMWRPASRAFASVGKKKQPKPAAPVAPVAVADDDDDDDDEDEDGDASAPKRSTRQELRMDFVNVFKDEPHPTELPDDQYPDWLWHITESKPKVEDYLVRGWDTLSREEKDRVIKLDRRNRARQYRQSISKKVRRRFSRK